jgi:hypothetical protein
MQDERKLINLTNGYTLRDKQRPHPNPFNTLQPLTESEKGRAAGYPTFVLSHLLNLLALTFR